MFIAEISSNHNQSLERCLDFVKSASQSGFDAVKFQAFKIEELFAPEILSKSATHRNRKEWEFPLEYLARIKEECDKFNIKLGMTPFYIDAVSLCDPYVDFFKVASYELTWLDLIKSVAATGKPVIMSTGMATVEEVEAAVNAANSAGVFELEILHCVSNYPAAIESLNLSAIKTLRDRFRVDVGWSDHTNSDYAVLASVLKWGAKTVEMHIDLDGDGEEFGPGHCWLPQDASRVINICRQAQRASGDGIKLPSQSEMEEREWRADPLDGLRPFRRLRSTYTGV